MQHTENLVEINNLTFKRGERVIYDNLNLQVQKGKVTAIMGPSGIGKTTLLRLIGGQLVPESGEILFDGQNVCTASNKNALSNPSKNRNAIPIRSVIYGFIHI